MWDKLKEQFNLLKLEKKRLYLVTDSEKFISKDDFIEEDDMVKLYNIGYQLYYGYKR